MGKQKKKSFRKRTNPLYRKGVEAAITQTNLPVPTTEQVTPVVDRLSCDNPTERAWAAACISNLILSNAQTRKVLLTKGIVPTLIQRLSDAHQEVRDESLGTLRNLVSVEPTIAKEYYSRHILEPLSNLLPQIASTIHAVIQKEPSQSEEEEERRKSIWDVTENFIYIIWCISEASDKHIKAINRMHLLSFLTSFLIHSHQCPSRVVIAAGQCLNTLTDDNKDIYIEFQNHPQYTESLLTLVKSEHESVLVKVLACAILINIRDVVRLSSLWEDEEEQSDELNKLLVPVLIHALDYDLQEAATNTVQSGHVHQETHEITPKPNVPLTDEEIYIQSVNDRLSIVQLALELLADICVQDEDDLEDGFEEDTPQDGDTMMEGDEQQQNNAEEEEEEEDLALFADKPIVDETYVQSNPVLHAFIYQVFPHLIRLATATPISYQSTYSSVSHSIVLTHQRALECLNNFLLAMNDVPTKYWFKSQQSDAIQLWRWLFTMADQIVNSQPEEWIAHSLLEVVIGCLWALGRGLGQAIPLAPTDVSALCGTFNMIPLESMRVKIIGCLGPIGMRKNDIETNKTIGLFMMALLTEKKYSQPAVVIEALNVLYDVYSDYQFDYDYPVFVQGGFLDRLRQIVPPIRSMVKAIDRRRDFDLRMRGDEALDNLNAFIKYKKTEQNKKLK